MRIKSVNQGSCRDHPVKLLTSVFPAHWGILLTPTTAVEVWFSSCWFLFCSDNGGGTQALQVFMISFKTDEVTFSLGALTTMNFADFNMCLLRIYGVCVLWVCFQMWRRTAIVISLTGFLSSNSVSRQFQLPWYPVFKVISGIKPW